ncbi:unnamed protein product [Paramecium octaurelia]|uniref:Uncharacterized protein n=1 Tax=Paramecium octaurelia TaxID=43137 RepID=A0A8S1U318_PAROT|nr:unnamed protein product [Paramecium octaurelia]
MERTNFKLLGIKHYFRYISLAKAYEFGESDNGFKKGKWKYQYKDEVIQYNETGQRNGKQVNMLEAFWDQSQVTYNGECHSSNNFGRWDIMHRRHKYQPFEQMQKIQIKLNMFKQFIFSGGGSYDKANDDVKIGQWIDLDENFLNKKQVTFVGEYQNGKKVGMKKMDRINKINIESLSQNSGSGSYEEGGDGIKVGKWIDLDKNFWERKQVTYIGEYRNGQKVGR